MGLSDSEKFSMIHSAILIQITRVTDGQTDSIAVAYTRYSYAVAHKNHGMHLLFQQDVVVSGGWVSEQFLNGTSAQYRLYSAIQIKS